jgi:hypothetical protein
MKLKRVYALAAVTACLSATFLHGQTQSELGVTNAVSKPEVSSEAPGIWQNGLGEGFRSGAQDITFALGANYGIAAFGSHEAHHLAIASLTYGYMLGPVLGEGHWYKGNPEFRLEAFTGAQFSPEVEWFVGLTPHLRYNFATGTRWIPFFDVGAGVTATGIGPPDLSGTFEFNLQAGGGVHYFLEENLAITLDAHFTHWSCGGIHKPNLGLNGITGMLGMTFFF